MEVSCIKTLTACEITCSTHPMEKVMSIASGNGKYEIEAGCCYKEISSDALKKHYCVVTGGL